jgi:putative DNA primase/helicase
VVDLHTGKLREHRATDYMTKQTAASPKGECPLWMKFLAEVTDNDTELQRYFQRIAGYCLTGVTSCKTPDTARTHTPLPLLPLP